ncbi:MAG: GTP-binding protein, partial [Chloroflexota bacterium]
MQTYGVTQVRNVALLSHGGAGKTTLSEAMLFSCGAISRQGRVADGNTVSDFDPEEAKRKVSINLSVLPCEWKGCKVNIVDTPGYADFSGEVVASLRACDGVVVVVCAASGVEVGTEQVWHYADGEGLARVVFINKMDRENADFTRALEQVQTVLSKKCVAVQVPIGSQSAFAGVVDLVTMKAYMGVGAEEKEIPAELVGQANTLREKLIEAVAELNDDLVTKYLEGAALTEEEVRGGLRDGAKSGKLIPVLAGAGLQNKAVARLLDAIV